MHGKVNDCFLTPSKWFFSYCSFIYFRWCQYLWLGRNWDVRWHLNSWFWYLQVTLERLSVVAVLRWYPCIYISLSLWWTTSSSFILYMYGCLSFTTNNLCSLSFSISLLIYKQYGMAYSVKDVVSAGVTALLISFQAEHLLHLIVPSLSEYWEIKSF